MAVVHASCSPACAHTAAMCTVRQPPQAPVRLPCTGHAGPCWSSPTQQLRRIHADCEPELCSPITRDILLLWACKRLSLVCSSGSSMQRTPWVLPLLSSPSSVNFPGLMQHSPAMQARHCCTFMHILVAKATAGVVISDIFLRLAVHDARGLHHCEGTHRRRRERI